MSDNVSVTPGTGATIAADNVGGVLWQRVKLGLGVDGTAADAVAGAGVVGTGVQRVTLASDDPVAAVAGTTADVAWVSGVGTLVGLLKAAVAKLGAVVLATGGNVIGAVTQSGTWTVGISSSQTIGLSGTLPAFASSPAVTFSGQSVGLTGTLPAFASPPAVTFSGQSVAITGTPTVSDSQSAPYSGVAAITPSDSVTTTAGRGIGIVCTVAGNVKIGFADASTFTFPVVVGLTVLPHAANQVFVTGTTATATYTAQK